MLAYEIFLHRFIRGSSKAEGPVQELDMAGKGIAENAAYGHHGIDARPAQFGQGYELKILDPEALCMLQAHPEQMQDHGYGVPARFHGFKTPEHGSQRFRVPAMLPAVMVDELTGLWEANTIDFQGATRLGWLQFNPDGTFLAAQELGFAAQGLSTVEKQAYVSTSYVYQGLYWFEGSTLFIQNSLRHEDAQWDFYVCDFESIGEYQAVLSDEGQVEFKLIRDPCAETPTHRVNAMLGVWSRIAP